jgi:hypothetical protein
MLMDVVMAVALVQTLAIETALLAAGVAVAAARALGLDLGGGGDAGDGDDGGARHPPAVPPRARWELML